MCKIKWEEKLYLEAGTKFGALARGLYRQNTASMKGTIVIL